MAKTAKTTATKPPVPQASLFRAVRGKMGAVQKLASITEAEAVAARKNGEDVVICGPNLGENMKLAQSVEIRAQGIANVVFHPAHANAGPNSLSHFQAKSKAVSGHTFFEAPPQRKAK